MDQLDISQENIVEENQKLLEELEDAYINMESILEGTEKEKEIVYKELQEKFEALKNLYNELSSKENMLIHMEKLSSVGQFITELIHELSNPLTAITAQSELLMMKNPSQDVYDQVGNIFENAKRMSSLLCRFRAMAYKGKEDFNRFDLNSNLKECLITIDIIKPSIIKLETDFTDRPLCINGEQYQITQILLNLAKNSFDAMERRGGCISVSSRSVSPEWIISNGKLGPVYCQKNKAWEKILNSYSDFALIEFSDNGTGIPEDILNAIFETFFTTKERGKGTGLGLSISSDIVKRHDGNIAVRSEIGKGTTFQILLPLVE